MFNFFRKLFSRSIPFKRFRVYYNHRVSALQTMDEISNQLPYVFSTDKDKPFIIDAGCNIGIATLFFQDCYPGASILCFEPDPYVFKWLQKNMVMNKLNDVQLVNAALSGQGGVIDFFGQIGHNADARGNSILPEWGLQRKVNRTIKVVSCQLSAYIHQEVDFLKIDIEGAEQQVLEELECADKLKFINEIALEVHVADKMTAVNDVCSIVNLLKRNQFLVSITEQSLSGALPKQVHNWAKNACPKLFVLRATRVGMGQESGEH